MKPWYLFQNKAGEGGKAASLEIFDEIGPWGVTAKGFNASLKEVTASEITLYINSIGGDVFAGLGIYNALRDSGKTINVKVMGLAASIASVIAMAGTKISMPENAFMMVHNPWTFAMGNSAELREQADILDKIGNALTAIYVKRTGKTEDEVKDLLKAESYLSAAEAVELGFADEVIDSVEASAKFDVSDLPEHVKAVFMAAAQPAGEAEKEGADAAKTDQPAAKAGTAETVEEPFAEVVAKAAKAAGLEDHASFFALDGSVTSETLAAKMAQAREVKALCAVAKMPEAAHGFIRAGAALADVRASLTESRAKADEEAHVDTTQRSPSPKGQSQATKPEVSTAAIWAKRLSLK